MPRQEGPEGRLAVIDVGSNSVRMVVYPAAVLAAPPLFNEKVICGLGRLQDSDDLCSGDRRCTRGGQWEIIS